MKLKIYCTSTIYRKILDNMPSYITPLGVGKNSFPSHWLNENSGNNILEFNNYYGEHTGIYWVWKNCLDEFEDNDWIGFCHYRKFWLNDLFETKQKNSKQSLFDNLLKLENNIFKNSDVILVQPIIYSNKNLFEDFYDVHKNKVLEHSMSFLEKDIKENFINHCNSNTLYPLNMFITKKKFFIEYCKKVFPWMEKCFEYCKNENLLNDYNIRLPSFLSERFVSFWFSKFKNKKCLSYARLGSFFLSNYTNLLFNPIKIPYSFRMYPTIHKY